MTTWKKFIGLASVLLASTLIVGFSGSTPTTGKMDPMLSIMTMKGANLKAAKRQGIVKSAPGVAEPLVGTILRFKGDLSGVKSLGGRIRSVIGDIATVDIPLSAVGKVAQLPNIVYIESAKPVKPRLDLSVPETRADKLRSGTAPNWTGATGKGVVIGIVDSGIDINHADFKDASGETRVLYLWDQLTGGTPPSGFTYGNECDEATIDAGGCTQTDTDGHGTHVAGIAAGNGAATGNGQLAYRYVGMAPEADLIIVKSSLETNPFDEESTTNNVLDGIAYIQAKAKALGKPCVINLSLGSYYGSHDGTSNYERGLDNASGAGKVIVSAAGNEAAANIHASGTVAQGGSTIVGFTVPNASQTEKIIIWYPGADQMGVTVTNDSDSSCTLSANPGEEKQQETACGQIVIVSTGVNPLNGDRSILFVLAKGTNELSSDAWSFDLSGISISNGTFDAWSGEDVTCAQFTTNIDPSNTLTDSSTATKAIAVAAYNTKNSWDSLTGPQSSSFTLEDIASFSSRGPRRSCSDITKCPTVQKPEITAPGNLIMSALSANEASPNADRIDADGVHIALEGTSMATPHVTGAVALLLEVAPTLTSDEIKTILINNAAADSFTGTLPNDTWGYGKMNVKAAYEATPDNLKPAVPADVAATAGNGQVTISWSPALGADSYNIYWSTTTGVTKTSGTKIANVSSPYVHTGLTNETTYYYVVTAVNANGESAGSSQVNASTPGCAYSITPATGSFTSAGGTGSITVTANCSWTASTPQDWISITSGNGTGNGAVAFSVLANTNTVPRVGTITIAGQAYTVTQEGASTPGCTYSITPTTGSLTSTGGTGSITVTANCDWTASTNQDWINITSGRSGTGNGTVEFTVFANTNTVTRVGTIAIAEKIYAITQEGAATSGGGGSYDLEGKNSGCFIATAAYGSYLDPHVMTLREFRDNYLLTNAPGQAFVSFYYKVSPPVADFISEHEALRTITRWTLTPVVYGVKYPMGTLILTGFGIGMVLYRRRRTI